MQLWFENSRGEQLNLWRNNWFFLVNVDGQTQANADISALTIGDIDGDMVTNVRAQPRTIPLTLRINPAVNVEEAKRQILKIVKLKQTGTIKWKQNDRTLKISGIIESIDMPRWNNSVAMQISIHCTMPYWEDVSDTIQLIDDSIPLQFFTDEDDYTSDMLYFPDEGVAFSELDISRTRTFENDGDVAVGMLIEIIAFDTVTNPIIYDADGNFFGVGYGTKTVTLQQGDTIQISTVRGNLAVTKNRTTNLLNYVVPRSTWLQLKTGENTFRINSADEETSNMTFSITFKTRYI